MLIAWLTSAQPAHAAQDSRPRAVVTSDPVDILDGDDLRKGTWALNAAADPDIYTVSLDRGEKRKVCFLSGASFCRTVGIGDQIDLVIVHAGSEYPTRIVGRFVPPMAVFDAKYRSRHRGETRIEVPEVYELVNVAIALTKAAGANPNLVATNTAYHAKVQEHFGHLAGHPFVTALDSEMRVDQDRYFTLKMNGYAFEFDRKGRIVRSQVYDRTGFPGSPSNDLLPYLDLMRDFARTSDFRSFYAQNRPFYQAQVDYLRTGVGVPGMLSWLRSNFPGVKPYDSVNIIFSPLVSGMQSVTWLESNGFRELQPHVNFPYPEWADSKLSVKSQTVQRGYILFTELNHGFINPVAERYSDRIARALDDRAYWATQGSSSDSYGSAQALFDEMMNWGLVGLYIVDKVDPDEQEKMIASLDRYMGASGRGFPRFPAFDAFLVDLYRSRPEGATIESLYPRIVEWFEEAAHRKPVAEAPRKAPLTSAVRRQ